MFGRNNKEKNYKFKSLRTYSWSKVVTNKKKFRKLFDRWEINYLSVELAFYNKLFDEENWTVNITLKAYTVDDEEKSTLHCEHKKEVEVDKSQNIFIYDFGWGDDEYGKYWEKGHHLWEAYVEDKLVGKADFYIEDHGPVTETDNPYFRVLSLRTYETSGDDSDNEERFYCKVFDKSKTRYISGELRFASKLSQPWLSEFFFNIYDDTGQLIGYSDVLSLVTPEKRYLFEKGKGFSIRQHFQRG